MNKLDYPLGDIHINVKELFAVFGKLPKKVGMSKALKMLNRGYDVFLWDKLIEKIIKNKPNKYKAEKNFKDIVDLNDLVIKSKNSNVYEKLKLSTFFSNLIFCI